MFPNRRTRNPGRVCRFGDGDVARALVTHLRTTSMDLD